MWAPIKPWYSLRISLFDGLHLVEGDVDIAVNNTLVLTTTSDDMTSIYRHLKLDVTTPLDTVVINVALEKLDHQLTSVLVFLSSPLLSSPLLSSPLLSSPLLSSPLLSSPLLSSPLLSSPLLSSPPLLPFLSSPLLSSLLLSSPLLSSPLLSSPLLSSPLLSSPLLSSPLLSSPLLSSPLLSSPLLSSPLLSSPLLSSPLLSSPLLSSPLLSSPLLSSPLLSSPLLSSPLLSSPLLSSPLLSSPLLSSPTPYLYINFSRYRAVIYSIERGDSGGIFTVNTITGDVVLSSRPSDSLARGAGSIYGPVAVKALDVDVWRPSRNTMIYISVKWIGLTARVEPSQRYSITLIKSTPSSLPVYSIMGGALRLAKPHPLFEVRGGVLTLHADRLTKPPRQDKSLHVIVSYSGRTRSLLLDVAVKRTRRYSPSGVRKTISLAEATAVGTPVWHDHRITGIADGNRFGWFHLEYTTGM